MAHLLELLEEPCKCISLLKEIHYNMWGASLIGSLSMYLIMHLHIEAEIIQYYISN